jgi:hypothetical protein
VDNQSHCCIFHHTLFVSGISPAHAEILAVSTIMASAALCLGEGPVRRSVVLAGIIFLWLTYILLALPTSLILVMPVIGTFALGDCFGRMGAANG